MQGVVGELRKNCLNQLCIGALVFFIYFILLQFFEKRFHLLVYFLALFKLLLEKTIFFDKISACVLYLRSNRELFVFEFRNYLGFGLNFDNFGT